MKMQAQNHNIDLNLHTLGWKAFQDLCSEVCAEVLKITVSIYREAQDGGQDAVFLAHSTSADATVQCKFSSKAELRLKTGDIDKELPTVIELVAAGRAQIYYFITSLGVDAPVAADVRDKLRNVGVIEPHVLGREWLTQQIRSSSRLRALVPRVYGLGDLSTILDERCLTQTRALLGHLQLGLQAYVPTSAHRSAVRVLAEHRIILLLGAPATGKSMLAAILATTAIDGEGHECLKCDGPLELTTHWNPNERNRLYWIDDVFGPNQLRTDFIDCWINAIPKIKAAIELGNRFILTSRSHIWQGAKSKLGTRNLSVLENSNAVVDLGTLSPEERQQIIYNHLKAGNQSIDWKLLVKPYLEPLAKNPRLLPEIARRLGDKNYTKSLTYFPHDLIKFVTEPQEFLIQTIRELDDPHQAALTLIFLHQGKLPVHGLSDNSTNLVAEKYGVTTRSIAEALPQLEGSFVSVKDENSVHFWGFVHPTLTDAISSILSARPDLIELYLQGTKVTTILADAICDGASAIRDAVIIPESAFEKLVNRLIDVPDTSETNNKLFQFLVDRSPDAVFIAVLKNCPSLLQRESSYYGSYNHDPRINFLARAHKVHLLPNSLREQVASELEDTLLIDLDVSFLDNDNILALFNPAQLLRLGVQSIYVLNNIVSDRIAKTIDLADPNSDVPDQFHEIKSFVKKIEAIFLTDETIKETVDSLYVQIDEAIAEVSEKKSDEDDSGFWSDIPPAKVATVTNGRSIFSDIEE